MFHQKNTMPNRVSGIISPLTRSRLSPHAAVLSSDFTCGSAVAKNRRCGKSRNTLNARNCVQAEEVEGTAEGQGGRNAETLQGKEEDAAEVTRCITRTTCEIEESTRKFQRCITRTTRETEDSTRKFRSCVTRIFCEMGKSTRNYQDALRANSVFQYLCA